jgi:predicted lipoprotein with Yx(FWY)xxD motif
MVHSTQRPAAARRPTVARIAGSILVLGGLSAAALAVVPAAASTVVVSTTKTSKGTVLESGGATLYILKGNATCNAQCQAIWPELVLPKGVKKATAGKGVRRAKLSSVMRAGGVRQVTYGGRALFRYTGDTKLGDVNGNITDTWGTWAAVTVAKVRNAAHSTNTTHATSGGGGAAF